MASRTVLKKPAGLKRPASSNPSSVLKRPAYAKRLASSRSPRGKKRIFLVRHGEGVHNATGRHDTRDPPLTELGTQQADGLRKHKDLSKCELLVVSPLSRAVQTAVAAFGKHPPCRVVLTPMHAERWSGRCDEGRSKSELLTSFPFLSEWEGFDTLPEEWTHTEGTDSDWQQRRIPAFRDWLYSQPESYIVCVGHGGFFHKLCGKYLKNCEVTELIDVKCLLGIIFHTSRGVARNIAAEKLGDCGCAAAAFSADVAKLLADDEAVVRRNAVRALGHIGERAQDAFERTHIAKLVSASLYDNDASVRCCTLEAFNYIGDAAALYADEVTKFVLDSDSGTRQSCARALGQMLHSKPLSDECFEDRNPQSIQMTSPPNAAQQLLVLLKDSDACVRYFAVEALGHIGNAAFMHQIAEALFDDDSDVCEMAAWALGQIGAPASPVAGHIVKLLEKSTDALHRSALEALGEIGPAAAAFAINVVRSFDCVDAETRQTAVIAIGKMGVPAAQFCNRVANLLQDSDASVRECAAAALENFGPAAVDVSPQLTKLLHDTSQDVRMQAGRTLTLIGMQDAALAH